MTLEKASMVASPVAVIARPNFAIRSARANQSQGREAKWSLLIQANFLEAPFLDSFRLSRAPSKDPILLGELINNDLRNGEQSAAA
jgi:hypothetical protein